MNTNTTPHEVPDLSILMEHTPHSEQFMQPEPKKSFKISTAVIASFVLLTIFSLVSIGLLVYQNEQIKTTELRSKASEFGDLFNSPEENQITTCQNIVFYVNNGITQQTELKPGDALRVHIPVANYSNAILTINDTQIEKFGIDERMFLFRYTIPQDSTLLNIRATFFL